MFSGDIVVHLNEAGKGETFNGRYFAVPGETVIIPAIQRETALNHAVSHHFLPPEEYHQTD